MLFALRSGEFDEHHITDETAEEAIKIITSEEAIQTFSLISKLGLKKREQLNALYVVARERYRQANAFAADAFSSEELPHFQYKNIFRYLSLIGVQDLIGSTSSISSKLLFQIRTIPSLSTLNELYFQCQDQHDIDSFFTSLQEFKFNGKLRNILKQSPSAAIASLFEQINKESLLPKYVSKALEILAKSYLTDLSDEVFAKKLYEIYDAAESFAKNIHWLSNHPTGR